MRRKTVASLGPPRGAQGLVLWWGTGLGFLVGQFPPGHAGGEVGDHGTAGDPQSEEPRQDDFRHGRHADGVGAHDPSHADLRRRFEGGAGEPHVDALMQSRPGCRGGALEGGAQVLVIGAGQPDETAVGGLAEQRVGAGEVDVVGDQHDGTGRHVRIEGPGGVRQDELGDADAGEHFEGGPHRGRVAMLVIMRPPGEHQHRGACKGSGDHLAGMARHPAPREARQIAIRNAHGVLDLVDEPAEPRSEHQRRGRRKAAQAFDEATDSVHHFRISPLKP